jgi:predicted acylesterase/phospholipase RssA
MALIGSFPAVAFDGGPAGLLEVLLLQELEEKNPGFLKSTKLFAGTSAGSITALVLASVEDGATKLAALEEFWTNVGPTFSNSTVGFIGAAFGLNAIFDNKALIDQLSQPALLGGLKMSDLVKPAVATAYSVQDGHGRVLSNLKQSFPGYDWPCVDVAVSSGASPLVMPAHLGYVDGGVFANNPTRPAIDALYQSLIAADAHPKVAQLRQETGAKAPQDIKDEMILRILSIAGGSSDLRANIGNSSWGYFRWLLDPSSFMRLVGLVLEGSTEAGGLIDATENVANYFRLDPQFINKSFIPFIQADPVALRNTAESPATKDLVNQASKWLRLAEWGDLRRLVDGHPASNGEPAPSDSEGKKRTHKV